MRASLCGAFALSLLSTGAAVAQPQAKPATPAAESPAAREVREKSGSVADRLVRGETLPPSDTLVAAPQVAAEAPGVQIERILAEERRRDVLRGKSGPFLQAKAAWEDKEWPPLIYAAGTLILWLVGAGIVIGIIGAIVGRFREN